MSVLLLIQIFAPIAIGLIVLFLGRGVRLISFCTTAAAFVASLLIFFSASSAIFVDLSKISVALHFASSGLSAAALLAITFFCLLTVVYSLKYMDGTKGTASYYGNILMTLGAASGVVLSRNLLLLFLFWGLSGITLYNLLNLGDKGAERAAKKAFVTIGGSDALMLFGISLIWRFTGTLDITGLNLALDGPLQTIAYLCIAVAALAKAGAMPFHSWIPDSSASAPSPVMALLPASIDKVLGIYLLAKVSMEIFRVVPNSLASNVLLTIGALTVLAGVFAALVQHDLRKLLSFHAISQVGYMVMGLGTGIPVGIAGGLFHMFNNAIYKSCLFFCEGSVRKQTGTSELDSLGGLVKVMPVTFVSMLIAALAISGVPPLNGFVSKWMIYQGIMLSGKVGGSLWFVWLIAAMFGSALTLASFMKVLNAVFFGSRSPYIGGRGEVHFSMSAVTLVLASLCVIFGVFAFAVPLKYLVLPSVPLVSFAGAWVPAGATLLIAVGLLVGLLFYLVGSRKPVRVSPVFTGGEALSSERLLQSGVNFYDSIRDVPLLKTLYRWAETGFFDLYEQSRRICFHVSESLKGMHNGLVHTYLGWCLIGLSLLMIAVFGWMR